LASRDSPASMATTLPMVSAAEVVAAVVVMGL
jgi:hypothetical protein